MATRSVQKIKQRVVVAASLLLGCGAAAADPTGAWLVDESGVGFETTVSKVPLFGQILAPNAARENVVWLILSTPDGVSVRIPERNIEVSGLTDENGRISGSTEDIVLDVVYDGASLSGTMVLFTENRQGGKNTVRAKKRELEYALTGRLSEVSLRTREGGAAAREALAEQLRAAQAAGESALRERNELAARLEAAANQNAALAAERDSLASNLQAAQGRSASLASEAERAQSLDARLAALTGERDELAARLDAAEVRSASLASEAERAQSLDQKLTGLAAESEELADAVTALERERDAALEDMKTARAALLEVQTALDESRKQVESATSSASQREQTLKADVDKLAVENATLQNRLDAASVYATELEENVATLSKDLEAAREASANDDSALDALRGEMQARITELEQRNAALAAENDALAEHIVTLETKLSGQGAQ